MSIFLPNSNAFSKFPNTQHRFFSNNPTSISQIKKEDFFKIVSNCVSFILESKGQPVTDDFPTEMPTGSEMGERFRVCNLITSAIHDLGYNQKKQKSDSEDSQQDNRKLPELSFDHFLYPNETVWRAILKWLIDSIQHIKIQKGELSLKQEKDQKQSTELSFDEKLGRTFKKLTTTSWKKIILKNELKDEQVQRRIQTFSLSFPKPRDFSTSQDANEDESWASDELKRQKKEEMTKRYNLKFCPDIISQIPSKTTTKTDTTKGEMLLDFKDLPPSIFEDNLCEVAKQIIISNASTSEDAEEHAQDMDAEDAMEAIEDAGSNNRAFFRNKERKMMEKITAVLKSNINESTRKMRIRMRQKQQRSANDALLVQQQREKEKKEKQENSPENAQQTADAKQEEENRRKQEVEKLEDMISKIDTAMSTLTSNIEMMNSQLTQITSSIDQSKQEKKRIEEDFTVKKKTANMLLDKDKNIIEMENLCDMSTKKLLKLAEEWENHRKPLIEEYRTIKSEISTKKKLIQIQVEKVKLQRKKIQRSIVQIKSAEEKVNIMQKEYESLPKDETRVDYVERILDVLKNVEKQKKEISVVLKDNKKLQEAVTQISNNLATQFKKTEELVFFFAKTQTKEGAAVAAAAAAVSGSATNSPANQATAITDSADNLNEASVAKKVYKQLDKTRRFFKDCVDSVKECGTVTHEIRSLEMKIDELKRRNDSLNSESVKKDLESVEKENLKLQKKIHQVGEELKKYA